MRKNSELRVSPKKKSLCLVGTCLTYKKDSWDLMTCFCADNICLKEESDYGDHSAQMARARNTEVIQEMNVPKWHALEGRK